MLKVEEEGGMGLKSLLEAAGLSLLRQLGLVQRIEGAVAAACSGCMGVEGAGLSLPQQLALGLRV